MSKLHPVFVVGMPRSGTTLLASLLNAHSHIAIGPETDYFTMVWKPLERSSGLKLWPEVDQVLSRFFGLHFIQFTHLPYEQFRISLKKAFSEGSLSHQTILSLILSTYAEGHNKPVWGEKTPDHFMYVPVIKSLFPSAKILAIVRDPRDVHLSLLHVPWNAGNAFNHALQWRQYQWAASYYHKLYRDDFHQIRFEDLVQNPADTMNSVCQWLHWPFEPAMLERYRAEQLFDPIREPWKHRAATPIDSRNMEKWRTQMPHRDVNLFSWLDAKYLKQLDYAMPEGRSGFPLQPGIFDGLDKRAVGWWFRTRWRLHRDREPWLGRKLAQPSGAWSQMCEVQSLKNT